MIRKDYFLKYFDELHLLIEKLKENKFQKKDVYFKNELENFSNTYLKLSLNKIKEETDLLEYLETLNWELIQYKLLEEVLYNYWCIEKNNERLKSNLNKLMNFINTNDKTYSIERQRRIKELS
ncbi:MAG: hypothetical protein Kow0079_12730 [Vicingaceae bacterium]